MTRGNIVRKHSRFHLRTSCFDRLPYRSIVGTTRYANNRPLLISVGRVRNLLHSIRSKFKASRYATFGVRKYTILSEFVELKVTDIYATSFRLYYNDDQICLYKLKDL